MATAADQSQSLVRCGLGGSSLSQASGSASTYETPRGASTTGVAVVPLAGASAVDTASVGTLAGSAGAASGIAGGSRPGVTGISVLGTRGDISFPSPRGAMAAQQNGTVVADRRTDCALGRGTRDCAVQRPAIMAPLNTTREGWEFLRRCVAKMGKACKNWCPDL